MHAVLFDDAAALVPLADGSIAWNDVAEATYMVHQRFHYEYPGPVADLHHRLMVVPREVHGDQRRIASRLDVSPHADTYDAHDGFGNPVSTFFARRVERAIEFVHRSIVTRTRGDHRVERELLEDPALRTPTMLTAANEELRDAAKALRATYPEPHELAAALNAFVFDEMRYLAGTTDVETTAATAFARRTGVCQDYAHVMLALARYCGLAARYVSGHLLGEGGTHAWVELLIEQGDSAVVIAYDPTHGRRVGMKYMVVAVGRDYADVAPTSGVFTAPYSGIMTTSKRVGVTRVHYVQ